MARVEGNRTVEPIIIATAALISAIVTAIGVMLSYSQWRRDVKMKLGQIREAVTVDLIRQRVDPYADFMEKLEILSSLHLDEIKEHPTKMLVGANVLQEATYGKVGLLASHNTRRILLYTRIGYYQFIDSKISKGEFTARLWALHFALRSDLGIAQPEWPNEVEQVHRDTSEDAGQAFELLIKNYPWHEVDLAMRNPTREAEMQI